VAANAYEEGMDIRMARPDDGAEVGLLLHDFNTEFDEPSPGADVMAERAARMIGTGEIIVLLAPEPDVGFALVTIRRQIWTDEPDAYLQELYVRPDRRGEGFGRALLEEAMEEARRRGATHFDLTTSVDDSEARALYESAGFTNSEGPPDGPSMLYYERDL
jgi:ribosomal protein S18 acetylase RimI-like enzyme